MSGRTAIDHLILYGTLRKDQAPYRRLGLGRKLDYVGPCRVQGTLYALGRFPGFRPEGDGHVSGDLFRLDNDRVLKELDAYERYNPKNLRASLFVRDVITVAEPSGLASLEAWIYVYNGSVPHAQKIKDGDWLRHRGLK